jgi:hypothetical protein
MATEDRKFGTFALTPANGVTIDDVDTDLLHKSGFKLKQQGSGSLRTRDQVEGSRISMDGLVAGTDRDDFRTKWSAFAAALLDGEQLLKVYTDRQILCSLDGALKRRFPKGNRKVTKFNCKFRSRFIAWDSTTVLSDTFTLSTATLIKLLTADTGDAETWPIITITENGGGFSGKQILLTNLSLGMQLSLQGVSMVAGEALTIDMVDGRVSDGTYSAPRPGSTEGDHWPLSAGVANTLELSTNVSAPNLGFNVSWRPRFWVE